MSNEGGARPGWYADPIGRFELRYFNGVSWTADVSEGGRRFVDPLGTEPGQHQASQSAGGAPTPSGAANGPATAAMVLGIMAVAIAWLPFVVVIGVVAAFAAIAFGWVGVRRSGPSGLGRSRAVVGLATGISALVAAVLGVVLTVIVLDVYNAYVDPRPHEATITECSLAGSRATATGTIENLGSDTADFSVLIGFVRPGTDNPHRTARAVVTDVAPGKKADFDVERQVDLDAIDCVVVEVTGPLPFGLDLD